MAALIYPTSDSPKITIRHLLSHAEGFPEDNPWGDRQLADTDEQLSRDAARAAFRSPTRPASPTSTPTSASRSSAASSPTCRRMPYTGVHRNAQHPAAARHDVDDAGAVDGAAEPAGARLSLGRRAVEGRAAAGQRIVRIDGRDADVGARSGRYVGVFLSAWPPRDGAETGADPAIVAARDAAGLASRRRRR